MLHCGRYDVKAASNTADTLQNISVPLKSKQAVEWMNKAFASDDTEAFCQRTTYPVIFITKK